MSTLEAGFELDVQVGLEVMEYPTHQAVESRWFRGMPEADRVVVVFLDGSSRCMKRNWADGRWDVWRPSIDWSAAWEVLTKVMGKHHNTFADALVRKLAIGSVKILPHQISSMPHRIVGELLSKLTPLSICTPALEAVRKAKP